MMLDKLSIYKERRPTLAVWKFTSCDGCQLSLIDCEEELLALSDIVQIHSFIEISSDIRPGPYDISLIEGSITTDHDRKMIHKVRKESKFLITIGACATTGGIQALRNFADTESFKGLVYARPEYVKTLATSTSISEHVPVDYELHGCPVNKYQLLEVIKSYVLGKTPSIPSYSVCNECKRKGNVCVTVVHGTPCLGPVTHAGCDALCPSFNRGCYGCFGPKEHADPLQLTRHWQNTLGTEKKTIQSLLSNFECAAESFKKAKEYHDER